MANLGDLTYDADAVYVDIPDSAIRFTERGSLGAVGEGAIEGAVEPLQLIHVELALP